MKKHTVLMTALFTAALSLLPLLEVVAGEPSRSGAEGMTVPPEWGHITERFDPESPGSAARRIILIQDAHLNYSAQKNAALILDQLARDHDLRLIFAEGDTGDISLAGLRFYGSQQGRREMAEGHLKAGLLAGYEYLDLVSDYPLLLWGVEAPELYNQHFRRFLAAEAIRQRWGPALAELRKATEQLKGRLLGEPLSGLEAHLRRFQKGESSLSHHARYLIEETVGAGLAPGTYPGLEALVELSAEKSASAQRPEIDLNRLLRDLRAAERDLKLKLPASAEERRLMEISDGLALMEKLTRLQWNGSDYKEWQDSAGSLRSAAWLPFLREQSERAGVPLVWDEDAQALDSSMDEAARFYAVVEERNLEITRRSLEKMDAEGCQLAALVVGGFHTEQLCRLFAQRGVAVTVVTPASGEPTDDALYRFMLKAKYRNGLYMKGWPAPKPELGASGRAMNEARP